MIARACILRIQTAALRTFAAFVLLSTAAFAQTPVVTVLSDFETESVATTISAVRNVRAADCVLKQSRGLAYNSQWRLEMLIGATAPNAALICDFQFRNDSRFERMDRIAVWCWLQEGEIEVAFHVRDREGRLFQTRAVPLKADATWQRVIADATPAALRPVSDAATAAAATGAEAQAPFEFASLAVVSKHIGRQEIFFDNLEVEHSVAPQDVIRGEFVFDEPTQLYSPGALVSTYLNLENISRTDQLRLSVELEWLRADRSPLTTQSGALTLPRSGDRFRSYQRIDFSQKIDEPGLYRLVARVRGQNWPTPAVLETTIAVTPSNRNLPRGRSIFFGARTNLLREPRVDQELEIRVAREVGVQLLAIDTPWDQIERAPDRFDFSALASVIKYVAERDMAQMLVLTNPPDWLPTDVAERLERQAVFVERLFAEFGQQAAYVQPLWGDAKALAALQTRAQVKNAHAMVFAPGPQLGAKDLIAQLQSFREAGVSTVVPSALELAAAREAFEKLRRENAGLWGKTTQWQQSLSPLAGAGGMSDAVSVFQYCMQAAEADAGGVIWVDLRDDDNDPRLPEKLRGMVRRDFSPKTSLLGLATASGMLSGLIYSGPLRGLDENAFESGVFVGGARQVAVIIPRPNRVRPALLTPASGVPGTISVVDFERRSRALATGQTPPLIPVGDAPFFLTLDAAQAQAEAEILLAQPWLRIPSMVLLGKTGKFPIDITLPRAVKRGYVRVSAPENSPVQLKFEAKALRGEAGESVHIDVEVERKGAATFEPTPVTVAVALDQTSFEFPITVRAATEVTKAPGGADIGDARYRVAVLTPASDSGRVARETPLHLAYESGRILIAMPLDANCSPDATLDIGAALEGGDACFEATLSGLTQTPTLAPRRGIPATALRGWRAEKMNGAGGNWLKIEIPARALGAAKFESGQQCLLAVRLNPTPSTPAVRWGEVQSDESSSRGYQWLRLSE